VLTEQGRAVIEQAAPAHVATVRRLVFDALTPQEAQVMAEVIEKVLARLEGEPVEETA
jgi:DNA-binding MarR family transcriptional regulator